MKAYFESQKVPFPILLHRNAAVLVPRKLADKIERLQLTPTDVFLKRSSLINKKVRQISNIDLDLKPLKKALEEQFVHLESLILETDASFEGAVKAQKAKQFKGIENLEKRLLKAQKRKHKNQVEEIELVYDLLFPKNKLQERTENFFDYYSQFGYNFIPDLIHEFNPLNKDFIVFESK